MDITGDLRKEFEENFGKLTTRQLWILTILCKNVRLRCRNNTAFNNSMNRIFPYATFRQIEKIKSSTGEKYPGLSIVVKGEEFQEQLPEMED